MNTNVLREIIGLADKLKLLLPLHTGTSLSILCSGRPSLNVHGLPTYQQGCDVMRSLGVQKWQKHLIQDPDKPRCYLTTTTDQAEMEVTVFIDDLPPTCRIVEKEVQIPKCETKETGEFITIKQRQIVCG